MLISPKDKNFAREISHISFWKIVDIKKYKFATSFV